MVAKGLVWAACLMNDLKVLACLYQRGVVTTGDLVTGHT